MTDDQRREVIDLINRTIAESLKDPDIASQSADYQQGYTRGFMEASLSFVAWFKPKPKP